MRRIRIQFQSIQSGIATVFVCLILFTTLVLSFLSYQLSSATVRDTARDLASDLIKQVTRNINTYISSMENISLLVLNHQDIATYLTRETFDSPEEQREAEEAISGFLRSILASRKDITSINIFGYNGRFVSDRLNPELNPNIHIPYQSWFRAAKEAGGDVVVSSSHVQPLFKDEYRWVVSLSRELRSPDRTKGVGILLVDLNFSLLNDILSEIELGRRGYVFITDREGKIVYHPQQQLLYSNLKTEPIDDVLAIGTGSFITDEGKESRIYTVQDSGYGWKIVGVFHVRELTGNLQQMRWSFVAIGALCLIIAILLSLIVARTLTRPIKQLQEQMREVERGNFDIQVPVENTREIGSLARAFNLMVLHIKQLMGQIVKEQEFKRKSELNALQAQINPHFLYNTLDSIIWMAEAKKFEEVVLMTSALAKLFRSSIGKGQELVPIHNEIEHIRNYLTIQKIRYQDKLDFHIDVEPDILPYRTIKLLLQPLVENAIYHGIKNKYGQGFIRITGQRDGNRIVFQVADNGVGMDETKLSSLLSPGRKSKDGKGLGIYNVNERIRLYFGPEYGLSFASEPDKGTTVTVTIAAVPPEKEAGGAPEGGEGSENGGVSGDGSGLGKGRVQNEGRAMKGEGKPEVGGGAAEGAPKGDEGSATGVVPRDGVVPNDGVVPKDGVVPNDGVVPKDGVVPNDGVVPKDGVVPNDGKSPKGAGPPEEEGMSVPKHGGRKQATEGSGQRKDGLGSGESFQQGRDKMAGRQEHDSQSKTDLEENHPLDVTDPAVRIRPVPVQRRLAVRALRQD